MGKKSKNDVTNNKAEDNTEVVATTDNSEVIETVDNSAVTSSETAKENTEMDNSVNNSKIKTDDNYKSIADNIDNKDMKAIADLLCKIQENNEKQASYLRKHLLLARITSGLSIVVVIALVICACCVAPTVKRISTEAETALTQANIAIEQANVALEQTNNILGEADGVIKNVDVIANDLAKADLQGMLGNVNDFVLTSEESISVALEKINAIDFESLNKAITDLGAIIAPLAKLFGRK